MRVLLYNFIYFIKAHFAFILELPRCSRYRSKLSMDLLVPCNSCVYLCRQPSLHREMSSPKTSNIRLNSLKCCRVTASSELHTPVGVAGNSVNYSPSIPTHKVTVHDRQRGVVHEFVVPEVRKRNFRNIRNDFF